MNFYINSCEKSEKGDTFIGKCVNGSLNGKVWRISNGRIFCGHYKDGKLIGKEESLDECFEKVYENGFRDGDHVGYMRGCKEEHQERVSRSKIIWKSLQSRP